LFLSELYHIYDIRPSVWSWGLLMYGLV